MILSPKRLEVCGGMIFQPESLVAEVDQVVVEILDVN
jgi:hypothetical protein